MRLLFLLLFPFCAFAEAELNKYFPRTLQIISVDGFLALNDDEVKEVYKIATKYFRRLGFGFRLKYARLDNSPCEAFNILPRRLDELECYRNQAIVNGYHRRKRLITYYMVPPYITAVELRKTAWLAGYAYAVCSNVAVGSATRQRLYNGDLLPESRMHHSAVVLAHEVAHLLCANHVEWRPNLMHPAANQYTDFYPDGLPILKYTKREIQKAFRKQRKNGIHS